MNLKDRTLLITGATGGIGSELCRQLSAAGVRLVLHSHDANALVPLRTALGNRHVAVVANLASSDERQKLVTACIEQKVEGIVNLAGIMDFRWYEDQSSELIEAIVQINLLAPMLLCRELLPLLLSHDEAVILNVGSTFGSIGHPGFAAYGAAKAGLRGFTEALGRELADTGVKVLYTAPRATATALNTERVNELNVALGNRSDPPGKVAGVIVRQLRSGKRSQFIGWPERLFVKLNAVLPAVVSSALAGRLAIIKRFAKM